MGIMDNFSIKKQAVNAYSQAQMIGANGASSEQAVTEQQDTAAASDEGALFAPAKSTKVDKSMDEFNDYLMEKQQSREAEVVDETGDDEESKEAAKEVRTSLSDEELKQLTMLGVDIEGVDLKDIMGMVNTLRGKAHRQQSAELLAEIKANNGDIDSLTVVSGSVKVAGTDVKLDSVDVADVMATETKKESFAMSDRELSYIIKNDMSINKENLYKAHFSGTVVQQGTISDSDFDEMKNQLQGIIEKAGYGDYTQDSEKAMQGARFLLDNDLAVTPENVKKYMDYSNYEGSDVEAVDIPENSDETIEAAAQKLQEETMKIDPDAVYDMAEKGMKITIQAAFSYMKNVYGMSSVNPGKTAKADSANSDYTANTDASYAGVGADTDLTAITAKRQMEEIRLSMTMEASTRIVKMDIDIDTKELSQVIDALKKAENEAIGDRLKSAGVDASSENIDMIREMGEKLDAIGNAGADLLAAPLKDSAKTFTVNSLYEAGAEKYSRKFADSLNIDNAAETQTNASDDSTGKTGFTANMEQVRRSYEAVGTAPRADMGDSITKAFANIGDLLSEMNIDVNYETERAAKILGYNQIEINSENIDSVVNYDRQVNQLMDNFYPEAVMGLIKDGVNPMDMPIEELNNYIEDRNYNEGVTDAKNFATYLRDIEKRGEISDDERQSYIGIYRLMDKLAKSGDREAGYVFANGSELNLRNLVTAMRSRKAKGLDVEIDDNFGTLEQLNQTGSRIDEQIEASFNSLESFRNLPENVEEFISEMSIEYNMDNAFAVDNMLNSDGGIYKMVSEIMSKMKFKDSSEEDLIDEETGNMAKSLMDGDNEIDPSEALSSDSILKALTSSEDMSLRYEDIRNMVTESMYDMASAGLITSMDVSALKTANAGLNILSGMAKNDRYQLPVDTESGTKLVNLTIRKAVANDSGHSVDISAESSSYGLVTAHVSMSATAESYSVNGYVTAQTSDDNVALGKTSDDFMARCEAELSNISSEQSKFTFNITLGSVTSTSAAGTASDSESGLVSGDTNSGDASTNANASTRELYNLAVALVKTIGAM